MTSVPILEAKNVCFNYQTGKPVLKELNISIPAGARVAIVGPNGAGKSTLFLHFNAILQPTSGTLLFQGTPYDYSRKSVNRLRQKIGLVFQDQDMQLFARLGILPEAREEHADEVHQAAIEQALVEQKSSEQFYNAVV